MAAIKDIAVQHNSSDRLLGLGQNIVLVAIFIVFSYFASLAVYRLFFHPLSKYPGPWIAKITPWYDVYYAYKGDKHLLFHQLHEQYGDFVRYGPNTLSINHPAALKAIYGHRSNVRKSDFYLSFPAVPGAFSTHTALDLKMHARKRRVMSHAFSESALKGVEDFVLEHVSTYINALTGRFNRSKEATLQQPDSKWTDAKNVAQWSTYLGFDVMGDLSFGRGFGMLTGEKPENRDAPALLMQAAKRHNTTGPMPWLHQSGFDRILFRKLNLDRDRYLAFSRAQVGERMGSNVFNSKRKDFFYYLLHSKDPETGEGFSKKELWGESNTLIIAGSDTTSTTLTSTIFYLLHNPSTLARLQTELRTAFSSTEEIRTGPRLNECKYLRACIDEALRLTPPVGAILPRLTLDGGIDVLGEHIPAGVGVGCPIYALHHHKDYVPNAFEYKPERWLHGECDEAENQALLSVFNPFSLGSRGCIGKPMAYLELSLALGRLLWKFDMRRPEGDLRHVGEGRPGMGMGRERTR
jgi:cytochrome P450